MLIAAVSGALGGSLLKADVSSLVPQIVEYSLRNGTPNTHKLFS